MQMQLDYSSLERPSGLGLGLGLGEGTPAGPMAGGGGSEAGQEQASGMGLGFGSPAGKAEHATPAADKGQAQQQQQQQQQQRLGALLTVLTHALQTLSLYQCRACVNLLHRLPKGIFSSGWVQQVLGRAFFEMNDYKPAAMALREMLRLEPFRLRGTEILSTTLWHLKREKELCALALQVVEVDRLSPEAWCVVGNCFSLQREPEAALKFFNRALQIDPSFTYAHTLSGHEAVNNEDLEKATQSFTHALARDDRHYNAWYGLGAIAYRQERLEEAEQNFRRALEINSSSSVLRCYLGMVLHAQGGPEKIAAALTVLTHACSVDVNNPQLHFQRAHVLIAARLYDEALRELELVRQQAPREPPVHILMGRVSRKLGRVQDALKHFNAAIDLDPKESASLKAELEHLDEPDEDEDEDEDEDDLGSEVSAEFV